MQFLKATQKRLLVFDGEGTEPREWVENNIHIYTFKKWFTNTMHGFVHQTSLQVQ